MSGAELTRLIWEMENKHTINKEVYYFDRNRQMMALTGFLFLVWCLQIIL
jgi:hypothetical protein